MLLKAILKSSRKLFLIFALCFCYKTVSAEDKLNALEYVNPRMEELNETAFINGKVEVKKSKNFYAKVDGKVSSINANIEQGNNAYVRQNEIIMTIDNLADLSLKSSEQNFKEAKENYNRQAKLFEKKYTSLDTLEKAKSAVSVAALNLEKAKKEYDNMILKAPFAGNIGAILLTEGNDVKMGDFLFSITSGEEKIATFNIPEKFATQINKGTIVYVDLEDKSFSGVVTGFSSYVNDSGHATAKVEFKELPGVLHGSFIQARILVNHTKTLVVPTKSVLRSDGGTYVYILEKNNKKEASAKNVDKSKDNDKDKNKETVAKKATLKEMEEGDVVVKKIIKTNNTQKDLSAIEGDWVSVDARVIVSGMIKLREGMEIKESKKVDF